MGESVSVRIDDRDLSEITKLSNLENKTKSHVLREILGAGIKEKKLEIAIKKFTNNEVTITKAANIAGIPLTSFMDILSERKIRFHYNIENLEEEFEGLI